MHVFICTKPELILKEEIKLFSGLQLTLKIHFTKSSVIFSMKMMVSLDLLLYFRPELAPQ